MTAHIIQMRFPVEPAPTPRDKRLDDAVKAVAHRVARNSFLPAKTHLSVWLANQWIIPLASIRAEFEAIR